VKSAIVAFNMGHLHLMHTMLIPPRFFVKHKMLSFCAAFAPLPLRGIKKGADYHIHALFLPAV